VFKKEVKLLRTFLDIQERIPLDPYERDHLMVVGRRM
ncbi:MAG: fibrillarin-like rRNA/tRNA 2'-O-methyltransferase, partial [Theionarchaea archaeon]|nr:fibrillarin-like rRNA/tRNA 2'-O-methyltransferase [Theionarchaea archaeon]